MGETSKRIICFLFSLSLDQFSHSVRSLTFLTLLSEMEGSCSVMLLSYAKPYNSNMKS